MSRNSGFRIGLFRFEVKKLGPRTKNSVWFGFRRIQISSQKIIKIDIEYNHILVRLLNPKYPINPEKLEIPKTFDVIT